MVKKEITIVTRFVSNMKDFGKAMAMPIGQFKKLEHVTKKTKTHMDKFGTSSWRSWSLGKRLGMGIRHLTHGFRGFKMEMLGVMFFGMGVQKFFKGLLTPAAKMVGIFDLLNVILGVIFLPIMLALLPHILKLGKFLMGLSERTKIWLGIIVLAGMIIGGALFLIGMMALGLGSLIQAFGKMKFIKAIILFVKAAFAGFGLGLIALLAIVVVAIVGFVLAWKENFGNIRDWVAVIWDGIKDIFSGAIDVIKGILGIFWNILKGDPDAVWASIKLLWSGIKKIFKGAIKVVTGLVVTLGLSLLRALTGVLDFIFELGVKLGEGFRKWLDKSKSFGADIVRKILEGIKSMGNIIYEYLTGLIPESVLEFLGIRRKGYEGEESRADDFIMKGNRLTKINPLDTVVGFKGTPPMGGMDTDALVRAIEGIFGRIEVIVNAPTGYETTVRQTGGTI